MPLLIPLDTMNIAPYVRYIHKHHGHEDYRVPPRIIYDYEFIFITRGSAVYSLDGREYILKAGDLHFIKAHVGNSCRVPKGGYFEYYACHFDPVYMGEELDFSDEVYVNVDYPNMDNVPIEEDLADRPFFEFVDLHIPDVVHTREPYKYEACFASLLDQFTRKPFGYIVTMRACLLQIIGFILEEINTSEGIRHDNQHQEMVMEMIRYMQDHFQEEITFADCSKAFALSPKYARALFKEATGKTWIEYLTHLRIDKAKQYLLDGAYTVGEISAMVGYKDIHYFSRLFKKIEGIPPKIYGDLLRGRPSELPESE